MKRAAFKRIAFKVVAMLVAVMILAAGVELLSNAYLYLRDGRYISARVRLDALGNTFIAGATKQSGGCRYVDTLYPHP